MKSVKEIRGMIDKAVTFDGLLGAYADILLAMLEHINGLHSDFMDCDKRIGASSSTQSVPAEWYHASVHSNQKLYREMLALLQAVNEFEGAQLKLGRQEEILAQDAEYLRLLLEEQPIQFYGPGLEETLARNNSPVDYTKPHSFDLQKEPGRPHAEYKICKCGLSEGNVIHV